MSNSMRSRFPVTAHLVLLSDRRVLLSRRFNTGYEDGKYSLVAGHVDAGESVTRAAIREAQEEAGLVLAPPDLRVVHVMNRRSDDERIDFFLEARRWDGEVVNREPHKCDDLSWFALDDLPRDMVAYVRQALECRQAGIFYSEFGW